MILSALDPTQSYAAATTEVGRFDLHALSRMPEMRSAAHAWIEQNLLASKGIDTDRSHMGDRLARYVNRPTRDGRDVELLDEEVPYVRQVGEWLRVDRFVEWRLVEVGRNAAGQVCKIALVVRLPVTRRHLFLCVGTLDRGLKTFYVTREFKYRDRYAGTVPPASQRRSGPAKGRSRN